MVRRVFNRMCGGGIFFSVTLAKEEFPAARRVCVVFDFVLRIPCSCPSAESALFVALPGLADEKGHGRAGWFAAPSQACSEIIGAGFVEATQQSRQAGPLYSHTKRRARAPLTCKSAPRAWSAVSALSPYGVPPENSPRACAFVRVLSQHRRWSCCQVTAGMAHDHCRIGHKHAG